MMMQLGVVVVSDLDAAGTQRVNIYAEVVDDERLVMILMDPRW